MSKDYYNILGVEKRASAEEIKAAFRKKAHQHHPDKGGNEEKFKEINEAYQVLGNTDKRQQYDQFGSGFQNGQAGGGFGGQGFGGFGGGANINMDDLGDLFGGFGDMFGFGGSSTQRGRERGHDLEMSLAIDFLDAINGTEREISFSHFKSCHYCQGSGHAPGAKIDTCSACGGRGHINRVQRTILGAIQTQSLCSSCQGEGKKASLECSHCHGQGRSKQTEKIKIKIPAGISEGASIRLASYGDVGVKKMPAGDLFLKIHINKHPQFRREGDDIYSQTDISIVEASLGATIAIDTAHGPVKLKVPEGTQPQTLFRLKEKGAPRLHGRGLGDHFVRLQVKIPKNLNKQQRQLLESLKF